MKIDAHQHFWKYNPAEFGWIDDSMAAIRRDFLPPDLQAETSPLGFDGVIAVQARQSLAETKWLMELAEANRSLIWGVVGWVPLTDPNVSEILSSLPRRKHDPADPKPSLLCGVRHVLHDEPDENYMLRPDFNAGIAVLTKAGLTYDILIREHQLPQTIEFVDRHPEQFFVLDHIGKPRIGDNALDPWRTNIRRLAERQNVFCKLSGVVTEADAATWTEAQILPYLETALDAFGPNRMMFGSDWPVCLTRCSYSNWHDIVARFASRLTSSEQGVIFGGCASDVYMMTSW